MDKKLDPPKPPYPKNNPWEILLIGGFFLALSPMFLLAKKGAMMTAGGNRYGQSSGTIVVDSSTLHGLGWISLLMGLFITAGYFKLWNDIKKGR